MAAALPAVSLCAGKDNRLLFAIGYAEDLGTYRFPGFILDYSCSGIHFFMIALLLITLKTEPSWRGFFTGMATAYLLTVAANTARVALYLKITTVAHGTVWLHEAIGTIVFISFLLVYYLAADAIGKRMGVNHEAH